MSRMLPLMGCVALALSLTIPASGAGDVDWQVHAGFDGRCARDAWTPLRVTLHNRGESQSGRVSVTFADRGYGTILAVYTVPVDLPQGSEKSYHLLVPRVRHGMEVELTTDSGTDVRELKSSVIPPEHLMLVVLGGSHGLLGFLTGTPAPTPKTGAFSDGMDMLEPASVSGRSRSEFAVAQSRWGTLPRAWLGWDGVDVVVVADSDTGSADPAEIEALRLWVRLGGTLVVTGGARAPALADGPLGDLLPLDVAGTRTVEDLAALEQWGEKAIPRQAALIADGRPREGAQVLLGSDETPLVVRGTVGAGAVVMTAFDIAAEPVKYWDGQPQMWGRLVGSGMRAPAGPGAMASFSTDFYYSPTYRRVRLATLAGNPREAALPPLWLVVGFLVAYLLALVPLNYWLVNRMGRREFAWLTTPLIIALFFGLAWGTGFALRGHQTLLRRVAVIEVGPGQGTARALGYAGIFSPAKMDYALRLMGTAVTAHDWSDDRITVEFGPEPKVRDIALNMWSARVVQVPFVAELGDGLDGHLIWDGSDLHATVRNNTGLRLATVAMLHAGRIGTAVSLAPGEVAELDMIRSTPLTDDPGADRTLSERVLPGAFGGDHHHAALLPPGAGSPRAWIVAVVTDPLLPVELIDHESRVEDATVIVTRLPLRLPPGETVDVPAWMPEGRTVPEIDGGSSEDLDLLPGPGTDTRLLIGLPVTWQFRMPVGPDGAVAESLEVQMSVHSVAGHAPSTLTAEVLNVATGEWAQIEHDGTRGEIADAAQCMTEDGVVRVRISGPDGVTLRTMTLSGSVTAR